jgi:hypothetical protein
MTWKWIYDDRRRKDPQSPGQSVLAGNAGEGFTGTKQGVTAMDQQTNKQKPSGTEGGEVKVGDKLILRHDRYTEILTVERITKSGRIKAEGYEFNPDLTKRGGGRWNQAEIATQEKIERIEAERRVAKARNGLRDIIWYRVPDSVVLATAEAYGLAMEKHNKGIEVQGE